MKMAYLDFDNMFAPVVTGRPVAAAVDAPETGFSALEWSVVALARKDTFRSLITPGRLSRAMGGLFGGHAASRLADRRLEALRRLSVFAWRRGFALPPVEVDRFLAEGFSEAQMETLVASTTGTRIGVKRRAAA
jgi:hypothetical protein